MYKTEIETKLKSQNYVDPGMIKAAFNFWYSDNDHIRSPFPEYIREQLQKDATDKLLAWCSKISDKAKKDISDEILVEKIKTKIRLSTTPRHVPTIIKQVNEIPHTISGKKVELAVTKILNGEDVDNKEALSNPASLEQFYKII